jgi:hypothetical protein
MKYTEKVNITNIRTNLMLMRIIITYSLPTYKEFKHYSSLFLEALLDRETSFYNNTSKNISNLSHERLV